MSLKLERSFVIALSDIDHENDDAYDDIVSVIQDIKDPYTQGYMTCLLEQLSSNHVFGEIITVLCMFARGVING